MASANTDLLDRLADAPEDEIPESEGPDPRVWATGIKGYKDIVADLRELNEVLDLLRAHGSDPFVIKGRYLQGEDFIQHLQNQRKRELAELILNSYHEITP